MIERFFKPIDNASLVLFRFAFGLIVLIQISYDYFSGAVKHVWADPTFHFSYIGFEWLPAWSTDMMYVHFLFTAACAVFIAIGLWYRLASFFFFLSYSYIFLIERAAYQDQLYLFLLIGFLIMFLPLNRALSVDIEQGRTARFREFESWTLWVIRFQVGVVYIYSGIAKLNVAWFDGEPVRVWLSRWSDFTLLGSSFDEEWLVYFFVYGILLFELLVVPALLWRRTRAVAFVAVILFNLSDAFLFKAGPFPLVLLVLTIIFADPSWVRSSAEKFSWLTDRFHRQTKNKSRNVAGARTSTGSEPQLPAGLNGLKQKYLVAGISIFVAIQLFLPLRAFLFPGDPGWTDEGQIFSWRMMFLDKMVTKATILIHDPDSGGNNPVDPDEYMDPWKSILVFQSPEMVRQFAWLLAEEAREKGMNDPRVHSQVFVSMNGRPAESLVDPTVNLAGEKHTLAPAEWILRPADN